MSNVNIDQSIGEKKMARSSNEGFYALG